MPGFDAGGDAGVGSQMVDQPKARGNEHKNDDRGSRVLLHASTVFLIVEVAHGIAQGVVGRRR
jgi:hypothetical protein